MQRDMQRPIPAELVTNQIGVPVAAGPPPTKTVITPKFILNVLRRWWKLASVIGVLLAVVAGFLSYYTYKPTYEATTLMEFRQDYIISRPDQDHNRFIVTQIQLIRSAPILAEALAKPEISSLPIFNGVIDPIKWLSEKVVASPRPGSNLLTISLRDEHKESVAKVVNAVREAYLANLNTDTARRNDALIGTLEAERNRRQVIIETDRTRLRTLVRDAVEKGAHIPIDIGFGDRKSAGTVISPADVLKQQITDTVVSNVINEATLKVLSQSLSPDGEIKIDADTLQLALDDQPEIMKLNVDLKRAENSLVEGAQKLHPDSGHLKKLQEEVKTITEKIATEKKKLAPKVDQELIAEERKNRQRRIKELAETIDREKKLKEVLEEQLEIAKRDSQGQGEASLDIELIKDNLEREMAVYDRIVERIDQIKTESRTQNQIHVWQEATEPKQATGTGPIPRSLMFAAVAFCLPFGGFFLWELRSRRVADAEDFADVTNLRVVGEISTLPIRSRFLPASNKRFEESLSRFEESIDYLRTAILIARHQRTVQSLVVCSAASREGKSTVAAHLASSLARGISGKVLLVDADMRRPHLHRLLDQDPENGLVDYLAGRCEFDDVLRSTWVERLDFVAAGVLDTPVGVLLANDRFERFLRQAERTYEFIVIDVPPILPVSEGLIIAKCADGAIFCGLRDVSTVMNISRACDKLRAAGVNIFGAVFNGVPSREYGASGYYYYRIPSQAAIAEESPPEDA